jgi:serine/threonine protein kinase/HAMP domain-containing protein
VPEVQPEDRTTPQQSPAPQPDPSLARDKAVLRPLLAADRDATIVLPRGRAAGAPLRPPASALPMALKTGLQLHEYRIDGVLGEGGFGITYLATDVHLNAPVAIKEFLPQDIVFRAADGSVSPMASEHRARYRQGLDSFLVEARTLASFRHRAIVRVARFFEANGTAYMVLEVEKGEPLKSWWLQHRQIGEKALVELLLPLLDGLAAVHAAGFLHRDIKPDNIQVRASDGSLVLLDFGSAGQTAAVAPHGLVVVTPGYAPIEQYGLGEQGPWTDLYALGATLYWAVSGGRKPPDAETRKSDPKAYSRAVEAGREVYGEAFLRAIDWALNTDPAKRPRSVAEFRLALCADHPVSLQRFEAARRRLLRNQVAVDSADDQAAEEPRAPARPRWMSLLLPRHWALPLKLALCLWLAAVVPMAGVAWRSLQDGTGALLKSESRYLQQRASQTAADVSAFVVESRRLAQVLASDAALAQHLLKPTEASRQALRERLQRLVQAGAGVLLVQLLDASGVVQAASDGQGLGTSQAMRSYFVAAGRGQPYTSGLLAAGNAGATHVYSSQPVRGDGGAVLGALVVRMSGDAVARLVDRNGQQDERLTAFLLDGDGVVVHHPHADLRYRSLLPLPADKQAEIRSDQRYRRDEILSMGETTLASALLGAQAAGAVPYDSVVSGKSVLAGYAPVAGHNWIVAVTQDQRSAQEPVAFLQGRLLGGALAVAALALAVAWWLARRITQPVRAVTHALHELKLGDYEDARVKATRDDELGQLGRALNALSEHLSRRDRTDSRP